VVETAGGVAYGQVQKVTVTEAMASGCSCTTGGELALIALGLALLRRRRRA
jgi:MYXO-CTERM domain-containing protein